MFGTCQPVTEYIEEALLANLGWGIEISWECPNCLFVDLEEQAVLTAEMLEDGTLRNAEFGGDIADSRGVVPLLGEVAHGCIDNPGAFRLGTRARRNVVPILRGTDQTAGNSTHEIDLESRHNTEDSLQIQFHFFGLMR
jgi:hypothetical protein